MQEIIVKTSGERLDLFLSNQLNINRSKITKQIKENKVQVNQLKVKPGYILKINDKICLEDFVFETKLEKENIKLDIIYEDDYIILVNKPSGMVVHPGAGRKNHTLVNALLNYTNNLSNTSGEFRLGIVHRIDADTSGILLISKTNEVHNILADMFKNHLIKRKYIALVSGVITHEKGKIDAPIGRSETNRKKFEVTDKNSKKAITNFKVLERYKDATLLELVLETGRTHQIRVHMSYIGHPIINDPVYNKKTINNYGQMLHAYYLGFNHPITNKFMEFSVEAEEEFNKILESFKNS